LVKKYSLIFIGYSIRQAAKTEMHYMDLEIRSKEAESNYAKLQGEYEEVGRKNPQYVNM